MAYCCIQCGTVKDNETESVIFKTVFMRRDGEDMRAGICKSCAKRSEQKKQARSDDAEFG